MADKNTVYPPPMPYEVDDLPDDEPEMLLQPGTRPISHEQLVVEVKGIYAGLVMAEAKCIAIDDMQAAPAQEKGTSDTAELKNEHWQSLIALHKQLLHEHQDFWLASQHPSASVALSNLAAKYDMRARMRRHGIHAFLETLGYRLPDSPEHVLAFPYIAYSMTALLYQTVPAFEDSWFECLGDLGNYITATEDDELKDHEAWNNVARLWYEKASDKSTAMGRRYYHLTILTTPDALEQLSLYTRSLICITNSITTSFNPILYGKGTMQCPPSVFEPVLIKAHALFFISKHADSYDLFTASIKELRKGDFLCKCVKRPKFKESGVSACISNIAALCEYGSAKDRPFRSRLRSVLKDSQMIGEGIKACFLGLLGPAESPTTKDYNMHMITLNCLYTYFNWLTEGFVPDAIDDREPLLERAPWHNHLLARLMWLRDRVPSVCLILGTLVSLLNRFSALQRMYDGRVTRGVSSVTDVATSTWSGFGRSAHFQKPASVVSMSLLLQFAGASPISKPEHGGRSSLAEFFPFTALGSSMFALGVVFVALYLVPRKGPIRVWGCVMAGSAYAWLMIRNDPTATLSLSTPVLGVWSISTFKYGLTTFRKFEIPDTFSLIILLLTLILDFSIVRFMTPTGVAISQSDLISVSLPSMSLTLAVAVNLIASVKQSADQQGLLSPTHDVDNSDVGNASQQPTYTTPECL